MYIDWSNLYAGLASIAQFPILQHSITPISTKSQPDIGLTNKNTLTNSHGSRNNTPLVIWHGMGDWYNSSSIRNSIDTIRDAYPDKFIYSVYISEDADEDKQAGLIGLVNEQVEAVCQQLSDIEALSAGFDAIGYSQGGLFLRAYIERCNLPKVRNLVTFGSPHNGVAEIPGCGETDFLCKQKNSLLKKQIWTDFVQKRVIAAQYFRDPHNLQAYLDHSLFLADINNEREDKNSSYSENLAELNSLVMIMFEEDVTVIPKESSWFADVDPLTERVVSLRDRSLYQDDWLGLRKLDERGALHFVSSPGRHMEFSEEFLREVARKYLSDS